MIGNESSAYSINSYFDLPNYFALPYTQVMNAICTIFSSFHVFGHGKNVCLFHYIQCSLTRQKLNNKEFPPLALMYKKFFVCTEFLSHLYKKFQVASVFSLNKRVKSIFSSRNLFFSTQLLLKIPVFELIYCFVFHRI